MIGALIGDLAASTWEKDKSIFYSKLIDPESQPSIYGITLMSAANLKITNQSQKVDIPISKVGSIAHSGQWLVLSIVSAWTNTYILDDFPQLDWYEKLDLYAKIYVLKLIEELRKGASKTEAFKKVQSFEGLIKREAKYWKSEKVPNCYELIYYVFRAWDSFYRGFDFTSSIHNAMKWSGDKHLLGILTGAFADAMYGSQYMMIKKKYAGHENYFKSIKLPDKVTELGFDESLIGEMFRISYKYRDFYSKNNALTNVEWHHWKPVTNVFKEILFSDEEHKLIMKSAPTHWDCRYGFYLDDGWHYIYRSHWLIARFKMQKNNESWRISEWQLSGERGYKDGITAFECALYEGCRIVNKRIFKLCQYTNSCKYFNGEKETPEKWKNTTEGKFWHGEMMFITSLSDFEEWEDMAIAFQRKLKGTKKESFMKLKEQQKVMICYIETLYSKWCPNTNLNWVCDY